MTGETAHAALLPAKSKTRARAAVIWPALPALAVLTFLLLRLSFDQGGYFPAAFTSAGAIAFLALGVLVVAHRQPRFSTPAWTAIGALAAFACWIGLSRLWSVVPDAAQLDMRRAMLYVALFGLGLLAADSVRHARALLWCVLATIVVVAGAGLLSRLQPELVPSTIDPFVAPFYRLDYPLGYWNALGALTALGTVLALGLAADPKGVLLLRAAAAGGVVVLLVTMYLSLSRGACLATIAGLVVLVAVTPNRGSLLLTLLICGGVTTIAIARLRGYPALIDDPTAGSGQATQGSAYSRELAMLMLFAMASQAAQGAIRLDPLLARQLRTLVRYATIGAAVLVVLAAVAGYVVKGDEAEGRTTTTFTQATDWLDRQWQDFLDPTTLSGTGTERLLSAKGARSDGYRVAIDGFQEHPLLGGGAGSFEVRYARDRDVPVKIRDAHSLPLETMAELGAVGTLMLLCFIGAVAAAARRSLRGKGTLRPAEAAAATAAFTVWLGHACVDWDWEMPALTGTAIVLSATLFQRGRRRRRRRDRSALATGKPA